MVEKIKKFFSKAKPLEERIFNVILIVGTIVVLVSLIVTLFEGFSPFAIICTAADMVFLILIFILAHSFKKMEAAKHVLCYFMNLVLLPTTFFSCGGVDSGMPLYLLAGIFLIMPLLSGKQRWICLIVSIVWETIVIGVSYFFMEGSGYNLDADHEILAELTLEARVLDVALSFFLVSAAVAMMMLLILNSYQKERDVSEELLVRLDDLSKKDGLTGLYNRREFFSRLDRMTDEVFMKSKDYYIAMFDIDHFKKINDTYGHVFGDIALKTVSGQILNTMDEGASEIAARYGGEEFVFLFRAIDDKSAFKRIEDIRKGVQALVWPDDSELVITISGGVLPCANYNDVNVMMTHVDGLLYEAKHTGRNRIVTEGGKGL